MTGIADIKMTALAALIVLTTVICGQSDETLAESQPGLPHAPLIETQVLTG
ncbi:MAG: hypothetical protein AB3N12_07890 [Ruegeria sp.]